MKRIYTILVAVLLTASVFAQTPEKMSYQAVIRNSSDQLVTNQGIGMQISILQGSATGTAVYVETHNTTTNANGLVTVEIGNGTVISGDFATINWASDVYFIQTETDPTTAGGTTYTITGTSQLLSVAYALHSKTAETITGTVNYTEADPIYTSSQANNITATDITNLSNLAGTNTGDQDISGIAVNTQAIQDTASQIRADIPDVSGFLTSETDPIYTSSQANNITATDITNLSNLAGTNTGDQDISGIAINTQAIQDTASQIRADIPDVSGFISTEADPVFTSSQANNITATDITNLSNLAGTNTGDQDISGIAVNTQAIQDTASQIRADIPDVSGFLTSETDPIYTSSQANNITAPDITNLGNLSGTNTGDQDGSETKVTAGTNTTVTGTGTTANPYIVNATVGTSLAIGDSYQGGIIFWLDATGQHGLIAATADQSTGMQWYNDTSRYTGTLGDGLYAGAMNTALIVATQMADNQTGNFAAKVCADYSVTDGGVTYGDWYLPSKYELNLLYLQKTAVGGIASAYYWSSTEYYSYAAWRQLFANGYQYAYYKYSTYYVRAIRAF